MRLSICTLFLALSLFSWNAAFARIYEKEPNDSMLRANPVENGETVSGQISSRTSSDWFSIGTKGDDTISVTFSNDRRYTGFYSLKIVDEYRNILARKIHKPFDVDPELVSLSAEVEYPGTYYVCITGIPPISYDLTVYVQNPEDPVVSSPGMDYEDIRLQAVMLTGEFEAVQALWHKGGEDTAPNGGRILWGYFYADPLEASWGSPKTPELFVKLVVDENGKKTVDLSHVSIPDIIVYIDYPFDEIIDHRITLTVENSFTRYELTSPGNDQR